MAPMKGTARRLVVAGMLTALGLGTRVHATGDGFAWRERGLRHPAGPAPANPTGPAPLNPTGPAPAYPTGPAPLNPTGPAPLDPTGAFHGAVRDRAMGEPVARSFFCGAHGRGFGSQQSFSSHLAREHGMSFAEAAGLVVDRGGVWIFASP